MRREAAGRPRYGYSYLQPRQNRVDFRPDSPGALARFPSARRFVRLSFLLRLKRRRTLPHRKFTSDCRGRNPAQRGLVHAEPLRRRPPDVAAAGIRRHCVGQLARFGGVTDWSFAVLALRRGRDACGFPHLQRVSPHRRPIRQLDRGGCYAGVHAVARPGTVRRDRHAASGLGGSALLFLLRAVERFETRELGSERRTEWLWWQAALLCVAAGALTKWTAPAFFYLTAIPFLYWRKRLSLLWSWPHLLSVLVALLPCLAWPTAVACQVGWRPLIDTVRGEALQQLSPMHHARPYPWSEVAGFPAVISGRRTCRGRRSRAALPSSSRISPAFGTSEVGG